MSAPGPDFAEKYLRTHGLVHYGQYLKIKAFLDGNGALPTDFDPDVTHPEVTAALASADQLLAGRHEATHRITQRN
jgi:hypothetical protein